MRKAKAAPRPASLAASQTTDAHVGVSMPPRPAAGAREEVAACGAGNMVDEWARTYLQVAFG